MDAYVGEIRAFPYGFAPFSWLLCDGSIITMQDHPVLISVIQQRFGGDGFSTARLPDLVGQTIVGADPYQSAVQPYGLGNNGCSCNVTLLESNLAQHTHNWRGIRALGDSSDPKNGMLGNIHGIAEFSPTSEADSINANMGPLSIGATGGAEPHENCQPYLSIAFYICAYGYYPEPE